MLENILNVNELSVEKILLNYFDIITVYITAEKIQLQTPVL